MCVCVCDFLFCYCFLFFCFFVLFPHWYGYLLVVGAAITVVHPLFAVRLFPSADHLLHLLPIVIIFFSYHCITIPSLLSFSLILKNTDIKVGASLTRFQQSHADSCFGAAEDISDSGAESPVSSVVKLSARKLARGAIERVDCVEMVVLLLGVAALGCFDGEA